MRGTHVGFPHIAAYSHVHLLSNSAVRHNSRFTLTFVHVCLSVGRSPIWEHSLGSTCPACRTFWGWFSFCASPGLSAQQEFSDLSPLSPCAASAWVIDSFRWRAGLLNESQNVAVVLNKLSLLGSHQWCSCDWVWDLRHANHSSSEFMVWWALMSLSESPKRAENLIYNRSTYVSSSRWPDREVPVSKFELECSALMWCDANNLQTTTPLHYRLTLTRPHAPHQRDDGQ